MRKPVILSDGIRSNGSGVQGIGNVAQRLLQSGFSTQSLRTCDVLRKDEWKLFDDRLVPVARTRLVGVGDLLNAGLSVNIPNPMGTTQVEWETVSDMTPAEVSMSGVTQGENDRVVFNLASIPLPIIHKDFFINIRALAASRTRGQPIDTTQMEVATRKVAELTESILFNGAAITVGGATIPGYTTHTSRNTGSLTADWSLAGTTGTTIVTDILTMIKTEKSDNYRGPYWLYVPLTFNNKLDEDFKTNSDKTIRQRILEIESIAAVRESSDLGDGASGEVILVQATSDVVEMLDGQQPTNVQWEAMGGMIFNFKVMSIMIPRFKSDALGQSGIAHFSV